MKRRLGTTCTGRRRSDFGAAAVEFALVVPILAMLLLGTVTAGLAYGDHVALTNAVREGARLGSTAPSADTWGASVVDETVATYANADNPLANDHVCALLIASDGTVEQSSDIGCTTGTTLAGTQPNAPSSPDGCYVMVWASQPADLDWLLGSATVTMHAQSVSFYERSDSCTS